VRVELPILLFLIACTCACGPSARDVRVATAATYACSDEQLHKALRSAAIEEFGSVAEHEGEWLVAPALTWYGEDGLESDARRRVLPPVRTTETALFMAPPNDGRPLGGSRAPRPPTPAPSKSSPTTSDYPTKSRNSRRRRLVPLMFARLIGSPRARSFELGATKRIVADLCHRPELYRAARCLRRAARSPSKRSALAPVAGPPLLEQPPGAYGEFEH